MDDNQWHHLAFVYDGTTKYIYLDGVLNVSVAVTGTIETNNYPVTIGTNGRFPARVFDGQLEDVRIYSRALSAADVTELYSYTNQPPTADDDNYSTDEDIPLVVPAPGFLSNDNDPDGNVFTTTILTQPTHGVLSWNADGSMVYTPTTNFHGTDSFTYLVSDRNMDLPVGYWPLDDISYPVIDISGTGNSGSFYYDTTYVITTPVTLTSSTHSLSFDGVDDKMYTSLSMGLAGSSFTVAAWAKHNTTGTSDFIMGVGSYGDNTLLQFGFRDTNIFTCGFGNNDLNSFVPYTDTEWHHWACTYDAATNQRTLYRDGVPIASDTSPSDLLAVGNLYIGNFDFASSDTFSGLIDDPFIYLSALSAAELNELMRYGLRPSWATVSITVQSVNDNPVGLDDSVSTIQGGSVQATLANDSLTTLFTANTAQNGNMFDVTSGDQDIYITSFDANLNPGLQIIEVYYKAGSYVGSEQTPNDWTLLGTREITGLVGNSPTPVAIGGLRIPAGETYGIYFTIRSTTTLNYTDGANICSDGMLTITTGTGNVYPLINVHCLLEIRFGSGIVSLLVR